MHPLLSLILFAALAGYVFGRRNGRSKKYALLAIPISLVAYLAVFIITADVARTFN